MIRTFQIVLASAALALLASPILAQQLSLSRGDHSILVEGVTAGERVIVFGVGRDEHGPAPRLHRTLHDSDHDGRIRVPVSAPLADTLVLAAIEFDSGRAQLAAWGWRPGRKWHDAASQGLEILWLRPGVAEWATRVTHHHLDTGPRGEVLTELLPGIEPGDVVLAVDLSTMRPVLMRSKDSAGGSARSDDPSPPINPAGAVSSGRSGRLRP